MSNNLVVIDPANPRNRIFFRGTALQQVRENAGVTAPEFFTPSLSLLTATFISSGQTISNAGLLTLAHGLGGVPVLVQTHVVCTSNDNGYVVGDILPVATTDIGVRQFSINLTATQIKVQFTAQVDPISSTNAAGASVNLVSTKWQFYVRAYI